MFWVVGHQLFLRTGSWMFSVAIVIYAFKAYGSLTIADTAVFLVAFLELY